MLGLVFSLDVVSQVDRLREPLVAHGAREGSFVGVNVEHVTVEVPAVVEYFTARGTDDRPWFAMVRQVVGKFVLVDDFGAILAQAVMVFIPVLVVQVIGQQGVCGELFRAKVAEVGLFDWLGEERMLWYAGVTVFWIWICLLFTLFDWRWIHDGIFTILGDIIISVILLDFKGPLFKYSSINGVRIRFNSR